MIGDSYVNPKLPRYYRTKVSSEIPKSKPILNQLSAVHHPHKFQYYTVTFADISEAMSSMKDNRKKCCVHLAKLQIM
jgi:hypothetical protein